MLYSTAGSRLYLANAPAIDGGPWPAGGWVEIGCLEAIGTLGAEWDTVTDDACIDVDEGPVEVVVKGTFRRPEMPLVMGNDPSDPGQLLLLQAARSPLSFPFRLVFPDRVTERGWFALVIRIGEVFDTANSVMKIQVDLKPTSAVAGTF